MAEQITEVSHKNNPFNIENCLLFNLDQENGINCRNSTASFEIVYPFCRPNLMAHFPALVILMYFAELTFFFPRTLS